MSTEVSIQQKGYQYNLKRSLNQVTKFWHHLDLPPGRSSMDWPYANWSFQFVKSKQLGD